MCGEKIEEFAMGKAGVIGLEGDDGGDWDNQVVIYWITIAAPGMIILSLMENLILSSILSCKELSFLHAPLQVMLLAYL